MTIVTVHQAKTHLSELIRRVEGGEEIIIARNNKPVVRLVLVDGGLPPADAELPPRVFGRWKGIMGPCDNAAEPLDDADLGLAPGQRLYDGDDPAHRRPEDDVEPGR